jgi:hypothetical protein
VKRANPTLVRGFGYVAIGFAVILGVLFLLNLRSRFVYSGPNYSPLGWMSICWAGLGVGLVYLKKLAVALFAASMSGLGIFVVVRSIIETPFPWTLINIALGLAFCIPVVPALRCWHALK